MLFVIEISSVAYASEAYVITKTIKHNQRFLVQFKEIFKTTLAALL